ncbi:hypothetical protein FACS1894141_2940 [Spirochaetia bacterium]|nr:hypothetical protein FACS1894141_2940 [Spirochaetia bacterium]
MAKEKDKNLSERAPSRKIPRFVRVLCGALSILLGLLLLGGAVVIGAVAWLNAPPDDPPHTLGDGGLRIEEAGAAVFIEVRNGESGRSVGQRLEEAGIIRNRYFWDILSRLDGEYIKAGMYRIEVPKTQTEIRSILVSGRQILYRVTIPEGVTLKKTARILEEAGICDGAEFLAAAADRDILNAYRVPGQTMEGYLYPDTYLFPAPYPASRVVRTMADTFFLRLEEIRGDALTISPEELNNRVILASIVEREYRVDDEAPLMAGVFYNRLDIGMRLQSCATVEYVITEIQGRPHPERLFDRDTEIRDPYNTYVMSGLPPGPISAPGAVALNAAFHPEASDFLFFRLVNPSEGRHYFSKTMDEHIQAGVLYVKGSR